MNDDQPQVRRVTPDHEGNLWQRNRSKVVSLTAATIVTGTVFTAILGEHHAERPEYEAVQRLTQALAPEERDPARIGRAVYRTGGDSFLHDLYVNEGVQRELTFREQPDGITLPYKSIGNAVLAEFDRDRNGALDRDEQERLARIIHFR